MLTQEEATVRVARGAALLDQHAPGWAHKIDIGTLRMASSDRCICGQLSGGRGWHHLPVAFRLAIMQLEGCFAAGGFYNPGDLDGYTLLQDAWISAIADRVVPAVMPLPVERT